MMTEANAIPEVRQLLDRQLIHDCILRYCSGVDRFDRELVLSAYHPDAVDDHGAFVGSPIEFVDWAFAYHAKYQHGHQHYVLNHRCDLDGESAHTETYWLFAARNAAGAAHSLHGGRYLDRFERRAGRWAIAARKCIIEWGGALADIAIPPEALAAYAATGLACRDRRDPSYQRPLRVTRSSQVLPF